MQQTPLRYFMTLDKWCLRRLLPFLIKMLFIRNTYFETISKQNVQVVTQIYCMWFIFTGWCFVRLIIKHYNKNRRIIKSIVFFHTHYMFQTLRAAWFYFRVNILHCSIWSSTFIIFMVRLKTLNHSFYFLIT